MKRRLLRTVNVHAFSATLLCLFASTAQGGSITAYYSYQSQPLDTPQAVSFNSNFGVFNNQSTIAFLGTRQDQPPGPGTDQFVPVAFLAYCVELGEPLFVPLNNSHPNVVPLIGSTTVAGGLSGPVTFDAARTAAMQTLWANFEPLVPLNPSLSPVFQLAVWEIAFDDDLTLVQQLSSRYWVDPIQFQPGITDVAEAWLTAIRDGSVTSQVPLVLLTGGDVQDLITTPEPATLALLLVGGFALVRRRTR